MKYISMYLYLQVNTKRLKFLLISLLSTTMFNFWYGIDSSKNYRRIGLLLSRII